MNPQYKHDCTACRFVGIAPPSNRTDNKPSDLYICLKAEGNINFYEVLARFGNDGPEYISADLPEYESRLFMSEYNEHPMVLAVKLAYEQGIVAKPLTQRLTQEAEAAVANKDVDAIIGVQQRVRRIADLVPEMALLNKYLDEGFEQAFEARVTERARKAQIDPSTKDMLDDFQERLCSITDSCRADMHEPGEQGLRAFVTGNHLDNAAGESLASGEFIVHLHNGQTGRIERFNLATLIALARKAHF